MIQIQNVTLTLNQSLRTLVAGLTVSLGDGDKAAQSGDEVRKMQQEKDDRARKGEQKRADCAEQNVLLRRKLSRVLVGGGLCLLFHVFLSLSFFFHKH